MAIQGRFDSATLQPEIIHQSEVSNEGEIKVGVSPGLRKINELIMTSGEPNLKPIGEEVGVGGGIKYMATSSALDTSPCVIKTIQS